MTSAFDSLGNFRGQIVINPDGSITHRIDVTVSYCAHHRCARQANTARHLEAPAGDDYKSSADQLFFCRRHFNYFQRLYSRYKLAEQQLSSGLGLRFVAPEEDPMAMEQVWDVVARLTRSAIAREMFQNKLNPALRHHGHEFWLGNIKENWSAWMQYTNNRFAVLAGLD